MAMGGQLKKARLAIRHMNATLLNSHTQVAYDLGVRDDRCFHARTWHGRSASAPNQPLAALFFLDKEAIGHAWRWLNDMDHAKRLARRPFVLTVQLRIPRA
jgi:hypothetical protein